MQNFAYFRGKIFWLYATGALRILVAFTLLCPALAAAQTPGLVAAYGFNETSGTTVTDASDNKNTGTFGGGVTRSTQGKFGGALGFDGSSAVTIPNAASLALTTGMTLEAWVFPTTTNGVRDILIKEGANVDIYNLYARNWHGLPESNVFVDGTNHTAEGASLPINIWTHVAGTYNGATLRLFINGVQVASTSLSGSITVSGGALRIGGNSIWGEYFEGRIDEVRIYNRALSQAEIQTDMNTPVSSAPSLDTTAPTVPTNLQASAVSSSQINLTWSAATDNVGVSGYRVYRSGTQIGTTPSPSYAVTGLTPATLYSFTVAAYDAADNVSAQSNIASANTLPAPTPAPDSGTLPPSFQMHHDTIPNFAQNPTLQSAQSGAWSNPATWTPARLPQAGDVVLIRHAVTYNSLTGTATTIGIATGGLLSFQTGQATTLRVGTLLVMPGGTLAVGTEQNPIAENVTAEIIITNTPLNSTLDPSQYGTALLGLGDVTMHGSRKSPTFVRLAVEPNAGQTTLSLVEAVSGWHPGDRLILPDTRHLRESEVQNWQALQNQWEELTLQSVSADGKTLTLTSPLRFDHLGARDGNGTLDFLPHVGNLARNVVLRSEVPIGSTGIRGHTLFTDRARVDIRYALFKDLGRTLAADTGPGNQIGRYPVHMHHVMGPITTPANGYQYTLMGNAIDGGSSRHNLRWGLAVHDSHYGLIMDNVAYNYNGYLIGTEDGSESDNVFDHNFAVRSNGSGGRMGGGNEGGGFWFRGPNNYIRNNVAANIMSDGPDAAYGFKFFQYNLGNIDIPNFEGADTSVAGQYTTVDGHSLPVLEFSGNEVYGATASGFSYWWVGTFGNGYPRATKDTVFRNLRIWHVFNKAILHYEAMRIIHDGLVIRGKDPNNNPACCGEGVAMNDYAANNITFRNVNIQGMESGLMPSTVSDGGLQTIENSYFRNRTNFSQGTLWTSAADASRIPPRKVILRNTQFAAWPGSQFRSIVMDWDTSQGSSVNTTQRDELFVYSYQGNPNDNFQVYYTEQATQNIAGGRAPCTATRPEIDGLVCPLAVSP